MSHELVILIVEAIVVYLLVLGTHALRHRFGLAHFYALLGGLTAIMSWVTDAGVTVEAGGVTFMVGSTVFYTSLLLGVFVIYVFDGPQATRTAISTIAGVSVLVPLIAVVLHFQAGLAGGGSLGYIPIPSLRINSASVLATIADLVFLAVVWECLGKPKHPMGIGLRAFLTLLGVMWLDVVLFNTGAFAGTPEYLSIMHGTFVTRFLIALFAWPFLYLYLSWQNRMAGSGIESRPVLAILKEVAQIRSELGSARREVELRKAAEREKAALLEAVPAPMFYKDRSGRYLGCNRAFETLLGKARKDIVGKTVFDMGPPEIAETYHAKDQELFNSPGTQSYEWKIKSAAGKLRNVIFSKATFTDANGNAAGLIGVILHITDRKRAEEERRALEAQLRQSQRLASIGTLAGGIAHGINNPIMGIANYAQLIADRLNDEHPAAEYATEIGHESERIASIVRDLLRFSEQKQEHRSWARPLDIVESTLSLVQSAFVAAGIDVAVDVSSALPRIRCHSRQIQQVLLNLLTNACDALNDKYPGNDEDKRITVTAAVHSCSPGPSRPEGLPGSASGQASDGRWPRDGAALLQSPGDPKGADRPSTDETSPHRFLRITVEDHGTGIAPETRERVFEPFFTTKDRSRHAGLGLSTAMGLVQEHGGILSLETMPGAWTCVHLDLPAEQEEENNDSCSG